MNMIKRVFKENDGMGVVEVVLIILVLVGLVLIFKNHGPRGRRGRGTSRAAGARTWRACAKTRSRWRAGRGWCA